MKNNNSKKIFEGLISRTKIYLVLIAILLVVICVLDLRYFTPSVVLYILILAYTYWSNQKRRTELSDHLQDLTFNIDKLAKNTMVNSPFPLVIAETNGNMIWKSNKFTQEFANIDINNTDMSYTYDQSIARSQAGIQNFSPGADGLIDAIERSTVEEKVKKQIDYDCLISHPDSSVVQMAEEIKALMVDVLCGERSVVSEGKRVSEETAKAAYRKITFDHVQYVMKSLVSYPDKISRIDRFLTVSLFNSVYTLTNSTFAGFKYDMRMKML